MRYAYRLADRSGARITLFHCFSDKSYNRPYDFGKQDYAAGIMEMLRDFYREYIDDGEGAFPKMIAIPGTIISKVASLSRKYDLIVLGSSRFGTKAQRWISSRVAYFASDARCPVLVVPAAGEYGPWEKIWHIKRKEGEEQFVEKMLDRLEITPSSLAVKAFGQKTFSSSFWRSVVAFIKSPTDDLRQDILKHHPREEIDLILLVSYERERFRKFVKDDAVRVIFEFRIPVLIFQGRGAASQS